MSKELHALHRRAGYPSVRAIQKSIGGKGVVSHTTIHHAFTKPARPNWGVVELVVEELAKRARPRINTDSEVDRFKVLWDATESHGEGEERQAEPVTPVAGDRSDLQSLSAPLAFQELIQELQRIKQVRNMSLDAFSFATGYSSGIWNGVLTKGSFPSRDAVLKLGERHHWDVERLMALWDRADESLRASIRP
ncbi:hypothetical protein ACIBAH_14600 [Streptomyces sp. NPDC051445]|uniref:hypothetical protein n=1 Tax=Streptomyces sp. NPDC051445 TaxID=3365653 RepID=UPI0037B711E5